MPTTHHVDQTLYTVAVRNFKDDPYREMVTHHGVFTDPGEAGRVAEQITREHRDFLDATVIEILPPTPFAVGVAHGLAVAPENETPESSQPEGH